MAIRHAFETEAGLIIATTLHTLGAIGVIAALASHMAWYRAFRKGEDRKDLDSLTFWLVSSSIGANLVGGFMRTYLPGHPTVRNLADSPWVQVVLLKHAFIFAALGALVYLHHWVAPRLRKQGFEAAAAAKQAPAGHAWGAYVVVLGVIVASVLGAMAQISPLGEGFDDEEAGHGGDPRVQVVEEGGRFVTYTNSTGRLTSTPIAPATASGNFPVPSGTAILAATLAYQGTGTDLELRLIAPGGEVTASAGSAGAATVELEVPQAGEWTYEVAASGSGLAVDVPWQLAVRVASVAGGETFLAETVTVAPGAFFEINTQMELGATFWWDWESSAPVAFDVHSHFDGEVQYLVEETTDAHRGSFTNEREGGYSLLWANEGNTPITVEYRVWGAFTVDSYFPPR